jgi:hypothetical protein
VLFLGILLCVYLTLSILLYSSLTWYRIAHIALVIPSVYRNSFSLTISATLNRRGEKKRPDSRGSVQASGRPTGSDVGADNVSARGKSVEVDEPRESVQDLV